MIEQDLFAHGSCVFTRSLVIFLVSTVSIAFNKTIRVLERVDLNVRIAVFIHLVGSRRVEIKELFASETFLLRPSMLVFSRDQALVSHEIIGTLKTSSRSLS